MTHVTCRLTAKKPASAPEPYAQYSSMGYLYLYLLRSITGAQLLQITRAMSTAIIKLSIK